MSHIQSQCWICPQCLDDRHHKPGDLHCLREQIRGHEYANSDLRQELAAARDEAERLRGQLDEVHSAFGIGSNVRTLSALMTNIENVKRFAEYLHAVERQFFMVPGEPDEDYPDCEPEDECLVNSWGSTKEQYLRQFEVALLRKQAEAVEKFAECLSGTRNKRLAQSEVDRLKLEAEELEKAGGGS